MPPGFERRSIARRESKRVLQAQPSFAQMCSSESNLLTFAAMYGHPEFDLFEAIYTTRAMRRLKPDPVPREIIMKVIEAATLSPSNSNRQPWIFVVVTEPETKQFVAGYYKKAWETIYCTPEKRRVMETQP